MYHLVDILLEKMERKQISKTIKELYIAIVNNPSHIFKFDGRAVSEIVVHTPKSILEKLGFKSTERLFKEYLLRATGQEIKGVKPINPDLDKIFRKFNPPQCYFLYCGRNIEFGYRYCDEHRSLCDKCKKREARMRTDGDEYCGQCF